MFSFIKKPILKSVQKTGAGKVKTPHSELTPEQNAEIDTAVDKVLLNYHIGKQSIGTMITRLDRQGTSVTLDLRLPHDANPEKVHHDLSIQLQEHGITELNLNVSLSAKKSTASTRTPHTSPLVAEAVNKGKGHSHTLPPLPKTTNAAATQPPVNAHAVKPTGQSNASTTANEELPIGKRAPSQSSLQPHPRIKHIVVVASGKGGVGKSTTTVNIALALQQLGNRVGVLDADIYGPSMPTMLGVENVKPELENQQFVPINAQGLAMLSIGSLLDASNTPVAWRGPKATGALMQLFNQTNWPMLDYLVIDMPPGTGDIQLTLAQRIPVTGAIIVTTPQHIALMDAQKGIEMFNKTNIPVLGVVENMALHTCSNCGHTDAIFGAGGGETLSAEYQIPLLGQLPLANGIRQQVDNGEPSVIANEGKGDDYAQFYLSIAKNVMANIDKFAKKRSDGRIF